MLMGGFYTPYKIYLKLNVMVLWFCKQKESINLITFSICFDEFSFQIKKKKA